MGAVTPEVSVVIPTYREAGNLPELIPRIAAAFAESAISGEVIVVDDDSRDGTEVVCADLTRICRLRLITRTNERGLATAVLCGLRAASGKILVVMDADLSHPPEAIPSLVAGCRQPAVDFVIGSRYVQGGAIDKSWTMFRRLNSSLATLLALGLTTARDPMAGFFAIKQSTFQRATTLRPLGYKIGLELIVRCQCLQVLEVPIAFQDRARGESKLSVAQQWLYLRHLGRLYFAKFRPVLSSGRFSAGLPSRRRLVVESPVRRDHSDLLPGTAAVSHPIHSGPDPGDDLVKAA
jgi:dolichol-phosphate mannosyltransferase